MTENGINNKSEDLTSELLLQDLFTLQVGSGPDRPAVISTAGQLTYGELHQVSDRWARHLRRLGVRPNSLVAVLMEKGVEQVVACMAILKSGAAYLPIDADLPIERLAYIIENSDANIVLTQSWLDQRLTLPTGIKSLCVDREEIEDISLDPIESVQSPDDLAFVIYTSGSTGQPKGVMIAQRGVVNAVLCTNKTFAIGPQDRVLAVTALHHDMSVYDIFGILGAGGTIVIPDAARRKDPEHWAGLTRQHGVTIWNSVPAMMEMLLEYDNGREQKMPDSLRLAFLGGDWISATLPKRLKARSANAKVVSVGGPTETTLWNIWYPVEDVDREWKSIPYGRPIANTKYYVMSESMEECSGSIPGELCCAGIGLTKGYWKDPEKTAARFTQHPQTGERLFRTGDMGRFLPDGNIEFLGRLDNQVKINGQRIELGEIEAALQQHDHVRSAVVISVGDHADVKRLVAYIVPASCMVVADLQLREYLAKKLPAYMIPSVFLMLDRLPLTTNGKVDRRALPKPNGERPQLATPFIEPSTKMEHFLAGIWRELLHLDRVGVADNLFDLGAQSIHVVQAHSRLTSSVFASLGIVALFQYPTVRALADHLSAGGKETNTNGKIQTQAKMQRAVQMRRQKARGKLTHE